MQSIITSGIKKKIKEQEKAKELAKLPPPTHNVDPTEMLSKAKSKETGQETIEETKKRLDEMIKAHEAKIKIHSSQGNIRKVHHSYGGCASFSCDNPGVATSSLRGSDTWYCRECYRKMY